MFTDDISVCVDKGIWRWNVAEVGLDPLAQSQRTEMETGKLSRFASLVGEGDLLTSKK